MATVNLKVLSRTQLSTNPNTTPLYTVVSGESISIDKCVVLNTSSSDVTINLYLVASGGSAGTTNKYISSFLLKPNAAYLCPEIVGNVLTAGESIRGDASTGSVVNIRISARSLT